MLYAAIVRSPHAAAKIRSIDISKAKAAEGRPRGIHRGRTPKTSGAVPCAASLPGLRVPHHNVLAIDRVYLVGHPVAVVVATDRYIARDGADLIEVDYDVTQRRRRSRKGARARAHLRCIRSGRITWRSLSPGRRRRRQGLRRGRRDREAAHHQPAADSDFHGNARRGGGVARGGPHLNLYTSTQIPHLVRSLVAQMLGLEENRLRVVAPEVGGGFGVKLQRVRRRSSAWGSWP